MGLVGSNREQEADADPLAAFLSKIDFSKNCPPEIKREYIAATEDARRVATGESKIPDNVVDIKGAVNKVKRPVKTYTEIDVDKKKESVIDFGEGKMPSI
jgi:hypothetical protein